jgi:outer membrane protein TolC
MWTTTRTSVPAKRATRTTASVQFVLLHLLSVGTLLTYSSCSPEAPTASGKLGPSLRQVERRLDEESQTRIEEPNSLAFQRATGEMPIRTVTPRKPAAEQTLTLTDCLQSAFTENNQIKQVREDVIKVGGSRIIANSRFLPSVQLITQYERANDYESSGEQTEAYAFGAKVTQRLLEFGKDNPIDVTLRQEQRNALFTYEDRVASVFSQVRLAFLLIKLKEQQIATRQQLLKEFEKRYEVKQQRMEAGNLSVKIEVLTARLNVLNEQTRINTLDRERFNHVMGLLRLIGLPVSADHVTLVGEIDNFGLGQFDMEPLIQLALAQDSGVAMAEAIVEEGRRSLDQIRVEYWPDLRFTGGYQDQNGSVGSGTIQRG